MHAFRHVRILKDTCHAYLALCWAAECLKQQQLPCYSAGRGWTGPSFLHPATQSVDITDDSPPDHAAEQFEEFADFADAGAVGV